MPDNPIVWIVAIVAVAIVVVFALWKGQVVEVELKPPRLKFKRLGGDGSEGKPGGVSVASGMTIEGSTTGDIAGVKAEGSGAGIAAPEGTISVGQGARISGSHTGDIVGVKRSGASEPPGGTAS